MKARTGVSLLGGWVDLITLGCVCDDLESKVPHRMSDTAVTQNRWIVGPLVDLSCISVGWTVFFLLPLIVPEQVENARIVAITFFVAHRYFTFPLVYLDRVEYARRKWTYLIVPVVCLVGVWLCFVLRVAEPEMFAFWWFFNYFHFVRQKYGLLRIYSGKTKWGVKRLDEVVVYGWGAAGLLHMLAYQAEVEGRLMHYLSSNPAWIYGMVAIVAAVWTIDELWGWTGETNRSTVVALGTVFIIAGVGVGLFAIDPVTGRTMVYVAYAVFVALTLIWFVHECRAPNGPSLPKILFLGSVALLYGYGPIYSATAVVIATSFSHAFEYFAICGLAVKNKARIHGTDAPLLSAAARHIVIYSVLFIAVVSGLLQGLKTLLPLAYFVFIYGTSFTHFVFDGMIWKLRRPRVAAEVGA